MVGKKKKKGTGDYLARVLAKNQISPEKLLFWQKCLYWLSRQNVVKI